MSSRTILYTYYITVLITCRNCPAAAVQLAVHLCLAILAKLDDKLFRALCRCKRQICPFVIQFCRCQLVTCGRKLTLQVCISYSYFPVFNGNCCFICCRMNRRSGSNCWNCAHNHSRTQSKRQPLFFFLFHSIPPFCAMCTFLRLPPPEFYSNISQCFCQRIFIRL